MSALYVRLRTWATQLYVCPRCGRHQRLVARLRTLTPPTCFHQHTGFYEYGPTTMRARAR